MDGWRWRMQSENGSPLRTPLAHATHPASLASPHRADLTHPERRCCSEGSVHCWGGDATPAPRLDIGAPALELGPRIIHLNSLEKIPRTPVRLTRPDINCQMCSIASTASLPVATTMHTTALEGREHHSGAPLSFLWLPRMCCQSTMLSSGRLHALDPLTAPPPCLQTRTCAHDMSAT